MAVNKKKQKKRKNNLTGNSPYGRQLAQIMKANRKNKGNRASASLNRIAHQRLKKLAQDRGFKLNHLLDEAVWAFLKTEIGRL